MNQSAPIAPDTEQSAITISRKEYDDLMSQKERLDKQIEQLQAENKTAHGDIQYYRYQLDQLRRLIFGAKRERFVATDTDGVVQLSLFDHVQGESAPQVAAEKQTTEKQTISYQREKPSAEHKKPSRQLLPAHLERREIIIEPENKPDNAREIGRLETEVLEYIPQQLIVLRYIRPKYVATPCAKEDQQQQASRQQADTSAEGAAQQVKNQTLPVEDPAQDSPIIIAPMPSLPIPKAIAGAGLLAHICVSKFIDHLPFYRQVQIFKRQKVPIAEATLGGWYSATCRLLEPLYQVLRQKVLTADYLQVDESPLPVLTKDKPGATHKGYLWVYHAPLEHLVYFDYDKSRAGSVVDSMLEGYRGALQTDGYAAYDHYQDKQGVTLLGCMAHARRKFEHAKDNAPTAAGQIMLLFQNLYAVERLAREQAMDFDARKALRKEKAIPIPDQIKDWLDGQAPQHLPKSAMGEAIAYTLNMWDRLKRYTLDGRYEIDNNLIENSIRPVALGRKNYLFAGSHDAARRAAMMYSFFACCKRAGVNPFEWLRDVLQTIPEHKANRLEELLPHNWKERTCTPTDNLQET